MTNNSVAGPLSSSSESVTKIDLGLVLGPHSDVRSMYLTWVQPWIGLLAVVDNLIVVLIFGPHFGGWCGGPSCWTAAGKRRSRDRHGVSLVSRIYFVAISAAEVANVLAGYIIRNSLTYLPFAVSTLIKI